MSESDPIHYWEQLGYPPNFAFELDDGSIGYCHAVRRDSVAEKEYVSLIACTIFFKSQDRIQAYSIYSVPATKILRLEKFQPRKGRALGDLFSLLRSTFREGSKE